ncbi:MAG TPA: MMPL family transporter [Solirubrobacteraceae bacterium]|nr:MMPL family transporter [Solirubrobacteraceae bacterium]
MRALLERVVRAAGRRPGRVLLAVAIAAGVSAALALRLEPSTATETLVGKGSQSYQATEVYRERFGDHAIVVLVRGDLANLVLTDNLGRLLGLEGCLSGNKPKDQAAPGGAGSPCAEFARTKPVKVVYGPGTFINSAVGEINQQFSKQLGAKTKEAERAKEAARKLAKAQGRSKAEQDKAASSAEQLVFAQFTRDLLTLNLRYGLGLKGLPRIDDPDFVSALVFDPQRGATTPKARFAYLFPNERSAVIQVRLKPDLSEAQRRRAIELVRGAVAMKEWQLKDAKYTVTGAPVVVEDLAAALTDSLLRLLVVALLVMAIVLALVFRSRLRLLPLAVALAAVAITFGLMSIVGAPLTMASIAVLPVLLGLGVDYAIQYQARVEEEEGHDGDTRAAAARTARISVPTIATAGLATGVGFLVLLLSPVPMVRGFGILLVVGIAIAFFLALSAGTAALAAAARRRGGGGAFGASARGAAELVDDLAARIGGLLSPLRRLGGRARDATMRGALERPRRVLLIGLVIALAGLGVDSQTKVTSDLRELVPQDLRGARDLDALQRATGVAGEIDVVVESRDLTDPKVVAWMRDYQAGLLKRYGYSSKNGCGKADLCPALSLPDLFRTADAAKDQARIRSLLDTVPAYFSQAVITADRKTATLAFGVRLMPLDEQKEVMDAMERALDPPAGVTARLAGLQVLGAQANAALSSPLRRLGTLLAGLLAVGLVLLLVYRRWERAWVPLVPIALATGWSALVLFALRVPLNPMSATLGALVIAISTEFSVLLTARFREERAAGAEPAEALRRTYASTGAAVVASGATAIAGFAVLALSDIQMLSDFGRVTVVDLSVSLLGVLAVLPAVLMLAERRAPVQGPAPPALREEPAVPA